MSETDEFPEPKQLEVYRFKRFDLVSFQAQLERVGLSNPDDLIVRSSVTENLVGSGGNSSVYKIPEVEEYVLRVPNGRFGGDTSMGVLEPVDDRLPELNIGQAVARMGGHKILKRQLGVPAGVPYGPIRQSAEGILLYQKSLARAAEMPQTSYDSLAYLFQLLNSNALNFDPSKSNNILIDEKNMVFNVVDINPPDHGAKTHNDLGRMVVPLMDNAFASKVKNSDIDALLTESRKTILLKSIQASKTANLPPVDPKDDSLAYSFELAGVKGQMETILA